MILNSDDVIRKNFTDLANDKKFPSHLQIETILNF